MSAKSIIGVIIVAILIGVLYVVFENNFFGAKTLSNSQSASSQELGKEAVTGQTQQESSLINYPQPETSPAPLTESSDLLQEARGLQMRDYSTYFEELKDTVSSQ